MEPTDETLNLVNSKGQVFPLRLGRTTIGRGAENSLVIPKQYISRSHAVVDFDGQRYTLTDLGSTHGTTLNGQKLQPHRPYPLGPGAQIVLAGRISLALRVGRPEQPAAPPVPPPGQPARRTSPVVLILGVAAVLLIAALAVLIFLSIGSLGPTEPTSPSISQPTLTEAGGSTPDDTPLQATATPVPPTATVPPPTPGQSPEQTTTVPPLCSVVSSSLNLRAGPGTIYEPPIKSLAQGTNLEPLAFWPNGYPGGGQWVQVRVQETGQEGWVSASSSYVSCNVDVTTLQTGIAPPTPTSPPPTPTSPPTATSPPTLTPSPTPTPAPYVDLPPALIVLNSPCEPCTTLRWDVENVEAIYLDGDGVVGHGSRQICLNPQDEDAVAGCYYTWLEESFVFRVEKVDGDIEHSVKVVWTNPGCETYIYADPYQVTRGQCSILEWSIDSWQYNQVVVSAVYLDGQQVPHDGTRQVCPQQTQTYTLRLATRCGNVDKDREIKVTQP